MSARMCWRVLWTLTLAGSPAWAGPAGSPVSLETLLEQARAANPQLRAARARWEAATKRPPQEGALPDPTVSVRDFGVGRPLSGLNVSDFAFLSLGVSQEIPYPGKRGLRESVAQEEARVEEQKYRQVELEVLSEVKLHYFDYVYVAKALETVARNRELLEQFVRIAEARYAVGQGIQQDIFQAQIQLTLLREREETLEQQRQSAAAAIQTLLDRSPDEPLPAPEELERAPFPSELTKLYREAQQRSPALRAREHEVSRNAAALDLSRKAYRPDFSVGFEWQRTGPLYPDYYMAEIEAKIPIYFWRKQRLGVEEAASKLAEARHAYQAQTRDLLFQIKDQYLMARTAERLLSLYETAILPQATLALESAISSYQTGSVNFLTLINASALLLDYELRRHEQLAAYHRALARMEPAIGRSLVP